MKFEIEKNGIEFSLNQLGKNIDTKLLTYACNLILKKIDTIRHHNKIEKITIFANTYKDKPIVFLTSINEHQYNICDIEQDIKNARKYTINLYYIDDTHVLFHQKIYIVK